MEFYIYIVDFYNSLKRKGTARRTEHLIPFLYKDALLSAHAGGLCLDSPSLLG